MNVIECVICLICEVLSVGSIPQKECITRTPRGEIVMKDGQLFSCSSMLTTLEMTAVLDVIALKVLECRIVNLNKSLVCAQVLVLVKTLEKIGDFVNR